MKPKNTPLDRLRQQYKKFKELKPSQSTTDAYWTRKNYYDAMRLFCLDCELVSFNDIEAMEYEVNYPSS